jgi:hypothetical protein
MSTFQESIQATIEGLVTPYLDQGTIPPKELIEVLLQLKALGT